MMNQLYTLVRNCTVNLFGEIQPIMSPSSITSSRTNIHILGPSMTLAKLILLGFLLSFANAKASAQSVNSPTEVKGKLLIIGGALRYDNQQVWQRLIQEAGGTTAQFAVIPTASGNPNKAAQLVVDNIKAYGANAYVVPLSEKLLDETGKSQTQRLTRSTEWVEKIKNAQGIYFTGGDQNRITRVLYDADGKATPLLEAIWDMYRRGGIIAGTSAGAAIMSETMFANAGSVLKTLQQGAHRGKEFDRGLGFIGPGILVDQHLIIRGRFARMLPVMQATSIPLGLGIDENTAMLIQQQREMEVIGYKGAIVLEMHPANAPGKSIPFAAHDIRIHYLTHGDKLDLRSKQITPSSDKERLVEAQSEEADQLMSTTSNILANTAVVELMSQLIESPAQEMVGLAFDASNSPNSKPKASVGFKFTFSKTPESRAYFSSKTGMEAYTIQGLRLDVTPIQMPNPLYTEEATQESIKNKH
ncbi:cyanophycinase [Undibacterium cyanobacteriorum]|uniref:Cyanophycinase n=1 Tax=Undibacterium cyanobacteriorum TaxID=3073561 RepID=A0ABY9RG49_9BURK|nr:cyanophycinase [Undibacterium sp. 20NA77.5]WMW79212.1 cyanophycinase [Undibacterium sp. 20NA77.5]